MSHSVALPSSGTFEYSNFRSLDNHSDCNDICRVTKNKNGEEYLTSAYSLKERFIQFLSYIPLLSRMDFVSQQIELIKAEQAKAVSVFLSVLRDEFEMNSFCSERKHIEDRPDFLKCKDISIWRNDAAGSTVNQREATDVNNKNLADLKQELISGFNGLSSESLDFFVKNEVRDNHVDVIFSKIDALLQKSKIPDKLHVNLRTIILEHINLNALDSEHSLKSISDFICDFMNVSHMTNSKVPSTGKSFKIPSNVLIILDRIQTQTGFTSVGTLLSGVAELKAEIRTAGQIKNEIRSSLHAYTMKNAYMHSLLAPEISTQPEDEHISAHSSAPLSPVSLAPQSQSVSLVSSVPPPPPMPSASSIPPAPLLTLNPLSQRSSQTIRSERPKSSIERPAQTENITSVIHDDVFLKILQKRRNALDGGDSNESLHEKSLQAVMLRGFNNIYPSRLSSDLSSSDDSGINSNSAHSSDSEDDKWNV